MSRKYLRKKKKKKLEEKIHPNSPNEKFGKTGQISEIRIFARFLGTFSPLILLKQTMCPQIIPERASVHRQCTERVEGGANKIFNASALSPTPRWVVTDNKTLRCPQGQTTTRCVGVGHSVPKSPTKRNSETEFFVNFT